MSRGGFHSSEKKAEQEIAFLKEEIFEFLKILTDQKEKRLTREEKKRVVSEWKKYSTAELSFFLECMAESDFENIYRMNRNLRKIAAQIQQIALSHADAYLYTMGVFNGIYSAGKAISSMQNEEKIFYLRIGRIVNQTYIKDILKYLSKHEFEQNKNICEYLSIEPNLLWKKMKKLQEAEAVRRYEAGKNVFYSLTDSARKYVKDVLGYKDKIVTALSGQHMEINAKYSVQDYMNSGSSYLKYSALK